MSLLAEKMENAGVDTIGAKLTALCIEAIRQNPESSIEAWRQVGVAFGHEFIRGLRSDMKNNMVITSETDHQRYQDAVEKNNRSTDREIAAAPYKPRVIPKDRLETRRKLQEAVRSKFKNSGGVAWSEVGWHELPVLARDGREAAALLAAGPAHAPNDGRSVGSVLGVKQIDLIVGAVRA